MIITGDRNKRDRLLYQEFKTRPMNHKVDGKWTKNSDRRNAFYAFKLNKEVLNQ